MSDEQANPQEGKSPDKSEPDAKIEELTNALARAMADLANYKRRNEEDKGKFVKFAGAETLKALLPTVDNLHRSIAHLPEDLKANEWAKGVVQVHDEMLRTLDGIGVKKIETVGQKLDPARHEALTGGPGEKDVILEEFEPGYTYHGEVLKPAKVKVGDGTAANSADLS